MGLHYLVDGYNLLYALPHIPSGPWPKKRETLLQMLSAGKPHGNNRLTIVFDSREGSGSHAQQGGLEIVFTAGETADDWISNRVRTTPQSRNLVVVTNDQGIRLLIKGTGAKWMATEPFMKQSKGAPRISNRTDTAPDSDSITEEFKKKWL